MRILIALAALLLLATFAPLRLHKPAPAPAATPLTFRPLPLDETDPARRQVGSLVYLGGWAISSSDRRFGGISAMHVGGREIVAFSDAGSIIRFSRPDRGLAPEADVSPLPDGPGSPARKTDRDIEAVAVSGANAWIAFESRQEIWRYEAVSWRRQASAAPAAMEEWRSNRGTEGMVRLPGGRFLVFSEGAGEESEVLLFAGDPAVPGTPTTPLLYRPPVGYRLTDVAALPDGRLLLLNRRFRLIGGISAKIVVLRPEALGEGTVLVGEEIAELRPPLAVDNMEALSVTQEEGRTILWIASDDNFNPLQRTLLLKFALRTGAG